VYVDDDRKTHCSRITKCSGCSRLFGTSHFRERERGWGGMLFCLHIIYDEPERICDLSFSLNVHCVVLYIVCTTRTSKRLPLVSRFREREEKTYGGFVVPLVQSSILYILYKI